MTCRWTYCVRLRVLEVRRWAQAKPLNVIVEHSRDDMYACTLYMDVLHVNPHNDNYYD